jgi:hypothetical protein
MEEFMNSENIAITNMEALICITALPKFVYADCKVSLQNSITVVGDSFCTRSEYLPSKKSHNRNMFRPVSLTRTF